MLIKKVSLLLLTGLFDLLEAQIGPLTFSIRLLEDTLTDPPLWHDWTQFWTHESNYDGYEPQEFARDDIVGPENWDEGHYLRFPQTEFPTSTEDAAVRWVCVLAHGTGESRVLALEKLGTIWNPATASEALQQVIKIRTRLARP